MITQRQLQTLRLYAMGYTSIEIAAELHISVRTVEEHLKGARESLEAKNSVHAVTLAIKKGIINLVIAAGVYQGFYIAVDPNYNFDMRRPSTYRLQITRTVRHEC